MRTPEQLWQPRLQSWAQQGFLIKAAAQALGLDDNQLPAQLTAMVEQLSQGDISGLPAIRLLQQQSMHGAAGAYSASKQTIYLNSDWANTVSDDSIIQVLTEELGHHLDALIHAVDTPGDEGRHFADLLTESSKSNEQTSYLELKDQGQIYVNNELVDVEFSQQSSSPEWIQVGSEINGVRSAKAGWAVSLSQDGTIIAVGAPYDDLDSSDLNSNRGSVTVYQDVNGAWQQLGSKIQGSSLKGLRGHSVSLSNDGTRVAVVTRDGNTGTTSNTGRVNIYRFTDGDWSQLQDGGIAGAHENGRIDDAALSGDGNYVILGSAQKLSGYAEVLKYNSANNQWEQVGSRLTGVRAHDRFGYAVDISDDGSIIAIGSFGFDSNSTPNRGAIYIYELINNEWSEVDKIAGDKQTDQLGYSVALSSDGTHVAVGARLHDVGNIKSSNEGYARVYKRDGSSYAQIGQTLVGDQSEGRVGTKVSISDDGSRLAVGAGRHDLNGKTNTGQVKLYELQSDTWTQIGSEINGQNQGDLAAKWHGLSLNGDGTRVAIGAHNNDNSSRNAGQVRIFDTSGITIAQASTPLVTTEAGSTASFTVVLDAKPTDNVTVSITGADSTEHQLSASALTFTTSNWNTAQTVTVTGVDDSIVDGDITTTITATASNTGGYAGTETATTTLKTSDNDNPPAITDQSKSELETLAGGSEILDLADSNSGNDTDQDGDAISYSITNGNSSNLFTIGKTTGKLLLATGQSLDHDTSDLHTLEITASATGGSTTAKVEINVLDVNNEPVAADDSGSVNENATLNRTEAQGLILNNDSDADSDNLTISKFHAGATDADTPRIGQFNTSLEGDYGTLTLQTNGSFSYVADKISADALQAGETQDDVFSYTLSDGKDIDTAEFTIAVAGVNDQPFLVDAIKTKKYTEGQINIPLIIDGSLDIRDVDDTNIESATVSISPTTFVSTEDTLAFTSAYGISSNWNSTSGVLTLSGSTTKANYINALQTVTYTNTNTSNPEAGARTIQWLVNDGAANSTAIESNIIVLGQNDAPEANNDTASVDGGSTVATQTNLLANDTDPEGHSRSITSFRIGNEQESNAGFSPGATVTGSYGKMTIQSDGTYSYQAQETGAYKLLAGETATETYTYTITDSQTVDEGIDSGEITITITGVNDSPTAIDDTAKIDEDSSKQFEDHLGILKNDTDIDGDQLYIKSVRAGAETSSRSLNTSTDSVSQNSTSETETQSNETVSETQSESSDSESSSESSDTGTSNESSDSESSSESSDTGASSESLDTEIQSKKIESGNQSSSVNSLSTEIKGTYGSLTVNPNGSYRYTANLADALDSGDKEIDRFTYTLTDLSSDDSAEMAIEVTGINDAPVLAAITGGTIADQTNSSSLVTSNISGQLSGTDADASAVLSFGITGNSSSTSSGNYGTLSLNRSTGAYEYLPTTAVIEALNQGDSVSDSFEVYVSDGSLSATQTFQVNITGANDSNGSSGGSGAGSTGSDSGNSNTDRSNATPSELIKNTDGSGFQVTGSNGVWVQLEVLRANADWQNSLQIVNSEGHAIGSIGATKNSTNMGSNEIFLSGGSEIKFHQSSNHQKLNHSPKLQINSELDNSFSLHLEDSDQQNPDYDDLSIKITSSQQPKNINAFKLSSQQNRINDPLLKMTDLNPGGTKLRITLTSDCGDTNRIAFVKLTANDHDGFSVGGIASTEENAFEAAVRDSLINPGDTEILMQGNNARQIDWTFNQNDEGFYAPVFINQETGNLVTYGVNNTFNGMGSIKNLGGNFFGYEDTLSAQDSDWDFNDITMLVEMI